MKVVVHNLYSGAEHALNGSPDTIKAELVRLYPWLDVDGAPGDVHSLVEELNQAQAFEAEIVTDPMNKAEGPIKHYARTPTEAEKRKAFEDLEHYRRTGVHPEGANSGLTSFCETPLRGDYSDQTQDWKKITCPACMEAMGMNKSEGNLQADPNGVVAAMLGYNHQLQQSLAAARFLCAGGELPLQAIRQALYEADGDVDEAALKAYGLEPSESNRQALEGVKALQELRKAESPGGVTGEVEPGHPDAAETARRVEEAFEDGFVAPVELGGKHSQGSLLARDQADKDTWLLKPGANGQSPAAGAAEEPASQSRREAAFWHVADAWGLGSCYPRADLLLIGGKEYAAIHLLPWNYKTMDKLKAQDPGACRRLLAPYLSSGLLFRWAVLDFVLGNPDRHAQNLMYEGQDIKLIDHGSALAGPAFDPAHDKNSFTPYYLRAWASGRFQGLPAAEKLRQIPRLSVDAETGLRAWLDDLHAEDLERILGRYGVNPAPSCARLAKLKTMAVGQPVDAAIARAWVET